LIFHYFSRSILTGFGGGDHDFEVDGEIEDEEYHHFFFSFCLLSSAGCDSGDFFSSSFT